MIITSTTKYTAGAMMFALICASVAAGMLYLTHRQGAELEAIMEVVGTNRILQDTYNDLLATLEASKPENQALASYFLTEGRTINFLSEIEGLARDMNLSISTDSLEVQPLPKPAYQTILLRLRLGGTKENLLAFIAALETLPYFSHIDELSFSGVGSTDGWSANIRLMVGLQSYDQ